MIFTVLVPEYIIGRALNELISVNTQHDRLSKTARYMANMGYFIVDFEDYWGEGRTSDGGGRVEEEPETPDIERIQGLPSFTFKSRPRDPHYSMQTKVTEVSEMPDYILSVSTRLNLSRMAHRYWALSAEQLGYLIPEIIDSPEVPTCHLRALNRGDGLVKVLALVQVTYLIVQLVARKIAGLPSAQLEIGALAFCASSFITYTLYWDRPQGVESIQILKPKCALSKDEIMTVAKRGPLFLWTHPRLDHDFKKLYDVAPIPNDGLQTTPDPKSSGLPMALWNLSGKNGEKIVLAIGAFFGGSLFGGLHCLAWNFHFPAYGEALAWRVAP
jgi:hypothetical protein